MNNRMRRELDAQKHLTDRLLSALQQDEFVLHTQAILPLIPQSDGRPFNDVREFKQLILRDEAQIARNLARQLTIYATGSPVRFSDASRNSSSCPKLAASKRSCNISSPASSSITPGCSNR